MWPYFCDCHISPPISKIKVNGHVQIVDKEGFIVQGFADIKKILKTLREHCLNEDQHLAIASRSTAHDLCMQSMEMLGWKKYFSSFQIYEKSKINHMNEIKDDLKFGSFEEVLFFDDDYSNIKSTSSIGVFAYEVDQKKGADMNAIIDGLNKFSLNTGNNKQPLLNI